MSNSRRGRHVRRPTTQWRWKLKRRYKRAHRELSFGQRFRSTTCPDLRQVCRHVRKKTMQKEGGASLIILGPRQGNRSGARREAACESSPQLRTDCSRDGRQLRDSGGAGARRGSSFALSFTNRKRADKNRQLYQKLIEAHNESGESAAAPICKPSRGLSARKRRSSKTRAAARWIQRTIQEGRVKLKAAFPPETFPKSLLPTFRNLFPASPCRGMCAIEI